MTGENAPARVPAPTPQPPSDSPGALIQRPMSPRSSSTCGTEPSCRPRGLHHCLAPPALLPPQLRWGMSYAPRTGTLCSVDAAVVAPATAALMLPLHAPNPLAFGWLASR